jgi:type II secretory pathway pseudopilin PulG
VRKPSTIESGRGRRVPSRSRPGASPERDGGWLLVELTMAIAILTIGVLGFFFSFQGNFRATHEIGKDDRAQAAIESVIEVLRSADYGTILPAFNGKSFTVGDLPGPSGVPASVLVQFFVDETAIPVEFGPIPDLDGDGARTSKDVSSNYILLPARLTLSYEASYGTETKNFYITLGPNR